MCALRDGGPLSQAQLVTATGIDQATIRWIVSRPTERYLLAPSKKRMDARRVTIHVTKAGEELSIKVVPTALEITERTFGMLNAGERVALMFTSRRMLGD